MTTLIVALDMDDPNLAYALMDQLDPALCAVKIGNELFTRAGPLFVKRVVERQFKVFLDLKFHDIPNTVARACCASADLGIWMLTVHASGGLSMMQAARDALTPYGATRPQVMAVTVLTSFSQAALLTLGIDESLSTHATRLACLAKEAGLDGVISSVWEVPEIKAACGASFLTVTPGIRLEGDDVGDQARVATPLLARQAGSDHIVMGRSITKAKDPLAILDRVYHDLHA